MCSPSDIACGPICAEYSALFRLPANPEPKPKKLDIQTDPLYKF